MFLRKSRKVKIVYIVFFIILGRCTQIDLLAVYKRDDLPRGTIPDVTRQFKSSVLDCVDTVEVNRRGTF